jgi:hypothetical protein
MQTQRRCRSAILSKSCTGALLLASIFGHIKAQTASSRQQAIVRPLMTICELLKNPSTYRGKLVTVTGIYWYGLREPCREPLVTGNRTWPTVIDFAHSDILGASGEAIAFATDSKSWDHLQLFVRQEARAGRREEIWVTVVGMFRAPESYVNKDGQVFGGYGHLGGYPAQLVLKTVLDISIKNNPTYDYRELLRRVL